MDLSHVYGLAYDVQTNDNHSRTANEDPFEFVLNGGRYNVRSHITIVGDKEPVRDKKKE